MIDILRAKVDDAVLVTDLSGVTFIETYSGTCKDEDLLKFLEINFTEYILKNELSDEKNYFFIAYADGFPAGYIKFTEEFSNFLSIEEKIINLQCIYVLKECQHQKVGNELLNYVINFAKSHTISAITLCVWEGNSKAINFYRKFKFIDTGKRTQFPIGKSFQNDHVMIKHITPD